MTVIGSPGRAGLGDICKGLHRPTHGGSFPHGRPVEGPHGCWPINWIKIPITHGGPVDVLVDGPVGDPPDESLHVTGGGHDTLVDGPHDGGTSTPSRVHGTPVDGPHVGGTSTPSRVHATLVPGPHDGGVGHDTPVDGPHDDGGAGHDTPVDGPHDDGGAGHDTPPEVPHNTLADAWVDPPCMDKAANVGAEAAGPAAARTTRMAADMTTSPPMRRLSGPMIAFRREDRTYTERSPAVLIHDAGPRVPVS